MTRVNNQPKQSKLPSDYRNVSSSHSHIRNNASRKNLTSNDEFVQTEYKIGIDAKVMNIYARVQEKENWCLAACIEMILHYHGLNNITQSEIVEAIKGNDYSNLSLIIQNLCNSKGLNLDIQIRRHHFQNTQEHAQLIRLELENNQPLIIDYYPDYGDSDTDYYNTEYAADYDYNTSDLRHAVVLEQAKIDFISDDRFTFRKLCIRDPDLYYYTDENRGRKIVKGKELEKMASCIVELLTINIIDMTKYGYN